MTGGIFNHLIGPAFEGGHVGRKIAKGIDGGNLKPHGIYERMVIQPAADFDDSPCDRQFAKILGDVF